jgi:hypothetical protein
VLPEREDAVKICGTNSMCLAAWVSAGLLVLIGSPPEAKGESHGRPEERACAVAINSMVNSATSGKYDPSVVTEEKATIFFQGTDRSRTFFGGHKYVIFTYFVDTLQGTRILRRSDNETAYCVIDDSNNVLGLESEFVTE